METIKASVESLQETLSDVEKRINRMDEELSLVNLSLHGNPRAGMNRGLISIVSDLAEKVDKISHVIDFEREYNERILDRLNRIFWLGGGFLTIFTILQLVLGYFAP